MKILFKIIFVTQFILNLDVTKEQLKNKYIKELEQICN